jgi:2-keto-4-pentenoate hydratase/2-oxohepta-3-ene-1,7-dioic acid hydratase in catechol pathway
MVRFCRFVDTQGATSYGISHPNGLTTVAEGDPYAGTLKDTGVKASIRTMCAPIQPTSVICIGLNYSKHAAELNMPCPNNPVIFMKPPSSAVGHGARVVKPRSTEKMDYEVELTVVIGKPCKDVTTEQALDYVLGYTVANDLSTRDWQKVPELCGGQWCKSKSFDGFSPLGPVLVTRDEIQDPNNLKLKSYVNGEKRQDSTTNDFIFKVQEVVSFLSCGCTLLPGTVILTGTPAGVAEGMKGQPWLKPGDKVVTEIEHIGALEVEIVQDTSTTKCYANMSKL